MSDPFAQVETMTIERLADVSWNTSSKGESFDDLLNKLGKERWHYCGAHPFHPNHFIFQRTIRP